MTTLQNKFINLTRARVRLVSGPTISPCVEHEWLPSIDGVAVVRQTAVPAGDRRGIPFVYLDGTNEVDGLPAPAVGVYYIVTDDVRRALPDRADLVSPHDPVLGTSLTVIGWRSFAVNRPTQERHAVVLSLSDRQRIKRLKNTRDSGE